MDTSTNKQTFPEWALANGIWVVSMERIAPGSPASKKGFIVAFISSGVVGEESNCSNTSEAITWTAEVIE
jgi:hypothetical protein